MVSGVLHVLKRAWVAVILFGCQDYYFTPVNPELFKEGVIRQTYARPVPADILFIVDNSGSMEDEQNLLANNFRAFIGEIAGQGDYQIAIISTDVSSEQNEQSGLSFTAYKNNPPYFSSDNVDRSSCYPANIALSCFRGEDPTNRIVHSGHSIEEQIQLFSQNVRVGSCGSGTEAGLEAMSRALNRMRSGCNRDFLRDDANLVVIVVSDEDDSSSRNIRTYVEHLVRQKPPEKIRFALIGGIDSDGNPSNCRANSSTCGNLCQMTPPPGESSRFRRYCHSCSYYNSADCCNADAASRYVEFARSLENSITNANPALVKSNCSGDQEGRGACLVDSICQNDFSSTLNRIARELVAQSEYLLDQPACNPDGITVKVNGEAVPKESISVSPNRRTVRVPASYVTSADDIVEIFFLVDGCESAAESSGG